MLLKNLLKTGKLNQWALPLLIPVLFFGLTLWVFSKPFFELNSDEGINLMKAMLLDQGYELYSQIWSDQPPLFTHVLAWVIRFLGYNVEYGRILVLFSSCILLWCAFLYLRIAAGTRQAVIGILAIILLPAYLKLSYSVMIGLPSIALAMIALTVLAAWHKNRSNLTLALSAVFLCLSVFTKLFTLFLFPVFLAGVVFSLYGRDETGSFYQRYRPAFVFVAVFTATLAGLNCLFIGVENIPMLMQTHLIARHAEAYKHATFTRLLNGSLLLMFLSALFGSAMAIWQRRWLLLYPIAWAVIAAIILSQHHPVWRHQLLLVTIPAAMLVPSAVDTCWKLLTPSINQNFVKGNHVIAILLTALFIYGISDSILHLHRRYGENNSKALWDWQMTEAMGTYAPQTRLVVTDRPIFAFRNKLPVPPELAVFSDKRLRSSSLEEQLLQTLRQMQPEQVVLARYQWPGLLPYLHQHYKLVFSRPGRSLYVRSDLASRPEKANQTMGP